MKNFKFLGVTVLFIFTVVSCAEQSNNDGSQVPAHKIRQGEEIGVVDSKGQYVITRNLADTKSEWEEVLAAHGEVVNLSSFAIVKTESSENVGEYAYLLIGSDPNKSVSTGIFLQLKNGRFELALEELDASLVHIKCTGCSYGCNIDWYWNNTRTKKIKYCKTNGCGLNCTKTEWE